MYLNLNCLVLKGEKQLRDAEPLVQHCKTPEAKAEMKSLLLPDRVLYPRIKEYDVRTREMIYCEAIIQPAEKAPTDVDGEDDSE